MSDGLVLGPTVAGIPHGPPLNPQGAGYSLDFSNASDPQFLILSELPSYLWAVGGLSAFSVEFRYKTATLAESHHIIGSRGRYSESSPQTIAWEIDTLNNGSGFLATLTTTGGVYILTDPTPLSTGVAYECRLDYDGSTARLFRNGTIVASHAATGTIVQPYWEDTILGPNCYAFDGGVIQGQGPTGLVDALMISRVSRHATNYTPSNFPSVAGLMRFQISDSATASLDYVLQEQTISISMILLSWIR